MRRTEKFKKESLYLLLQCWFNYSKCVKIGGIDFYSTADNPLLERLKCFLIVNKKLTIEGVENAKKSKSILQSY